MDPKLHLEREIDRLQRENIALRDRIAELESICQAGWDVVDAVRRATGDLNE